MTSRLWFTISLMLTFACGGATQQAVEAPRAEKLAGERVPVGTNFKSVIAVIPVKDHVAAVAWYGSWIGRDADVVPMDGVAEWNLAGGGWLQVALDPEHAGSTTVVVGVVDADAQHASLAAAGVATGDVQDLGFIKLVEAVDPDGNKIVFVQETGAP